MTKVKPHRSKFFAWSDIPPLGALALATFNWMLTPEREDDDLRFSLFVFMTLLLIYYVYKWFSSRRRRKKLEGTQEPKQIKKTIEKVKENNTAVTNVQMQLLTEMSSNRAIEELKEDIDDTRVRVSLYDVSLDQNGNYVFSNRWYVIPSATHVEPRSVHDEAVARFLVELFERELPTSGTLLPGLIPPKRTFPLLDVSQKEISFEDLYYGHNSTVHPRTAQYFIASSLSLTSPTIRPRRFRLRFFEEINPDQSKAYKAIVIERESNREHNGDIPVPSRSLFLALRNAQRIHEAANDLSPLAKIHQDYITLHEQNLHRIQ